MTEAGADRIGAGNGVILLEKRKIKGCPGRTITVFRTPFRVSLNQGMPLHGFRQLCLVSGTHSDERQPVIFPTHSHQA